MSFFHEKFSALNGQGTYYLLIFPGNPNCYNQINFTELFNVVMLIAHINMPCIFITDN